MKHNSTHLWDAFKNALTEAIQDIPIDQIEKAWELSPNRTEFYLGLVLPLVANKLELGYEREKTFRVDGIFYKKAKNGYQVPLVFIESENNPEDTHSEIYKLCCLNAPLKVIFICIEWNESNRKDITEDYWQYILDDFVTENSIIGHLGVIVADGSGNDFKFYSFAYNELGIMIDSDRLFLEIG